MSYKHDKAMKRLIARRKAYRKALAKGAAGMNENETLRLIIMRPYRRGPVFSLRTWEEKSERAVIEARLIQVVVDHQTLQPKPVPGFFIEAVERAQGGAVERSSAA